MRMRSFLRFFWGSLVCVSLTIAACRNEAQDESRIVSNLRAFAKLYGYVRYFHPSDEASRIDWDAFALHGAESVKGAKNTQKLKSDLEELFLPVAPTAVIYRTGEAPSESRMSAPEVTPGLKVVAWQHRGLGFGRGNSPYMSVRVNRENILWTGMGAGILTQGIDARGIRGKEIRLRAQVKASVQGAGNQAQLWLRVDREGNKMGFFDNMEDSPILSPEWREYEITGKVDEDALMVFFGAILNGNGQAWWDGFQMWVKEENKSWKPMDISNPGFEEESGGQIPLYWSAQSPGYKYTVKDETPAEGKNCLLLECSSVKYSGKLYAEHPQIGEAVVKELDAGLSCRIPLALYSDDRGTRGSKNSAAFDSLVSKLESYQIGRLTANLEVVHLADVIIAWNIFQHFYPYFDVLRVNWDEELTRALTAALSDANEEAFFETLSRMVAALGDGHGNVMHKSRFALAGFPIRAVWVENQLVVTASEDSQHFQRGDIIQSIDGVGSEQVLLQTEELFSGSPQWKRFKACQQFCLGEEGSPVRFKIRRGKEVLEFEVERRFRGLIAEPKAPSIHELSKGVYYIDLDRATWDEIRPQLDALARAKGVIFDLRGYPKGNHEIICHLLTEKDTSNAWMQIPQIIYPDREKITGYQKMGWNLMVKEPHIEGKVIFITDGRAISYAESFLSFIEYYKLGEIVGQPTAGANGNVNPFSLPGGYMISWTGMKVQKHDGSQHHLIGIRPTVPAERTIRGIAEGRDELLERALAIVR